MRNERENAKVDKPTDKKPSKSKDSNEKSTLGESVALLKKEVLALKKVNKSLKKTIPPAMRTAFAGAGEKKGGDKKKSALGGVGRLLP